MVVELSFKCHQRWPKQVFVSRTLQRDWFLKLTSDMDCSSSSNIENWKIHLNFMRQFLKGMLVDDAWSRNSICVFTFWLIARNHLEHEGVVQYYGKTTIHFYLRHSGDIKKGERTTLALSLPALFQFIASCLGFWQQELLLCPLQNMLRTASNFTLKKRQDGVYVSISTIFRF